jgi:hypothetical protein
MELGYTVIMWAKLLLGSNYLKPLYLEALKKGWLEIVQNIEEAVKQSGRKPLCLEKERYELAMESENLELWTHVFRTLNEENKLMFTVRIMEQLPLLPSHFTPPLLELFDKEGESLERLLDMAISLNNEHLALTCLGLDKTLIPRVYTYPDTKLVKELKTRIFATRAL